MRKLIVNKQMYQKTIFKRKGTHRSGLGALFLVFSNTCWATERLHSQTRYAFKFSNNKVKKNTRPNLLV